MRESLKRLSLGLALLLGGFFAISNLWLLSAGVGRTFKNAEDVPQGSVLVLLGVNEFVYPNGKPQRSEIYWQRIEAAADLAKTGRIKFIIASGEGSQAEKMANHLKTAGVTCPIVCDAFGNRTLDSVRRVASGYANEKIIFVSQEWHCDRALWMADRSGLKAWSYPANFGTGYYAYYGFMRDCLAKPKAVLDWVAGSRLSTSQPVGTGFIAFSH